MLTLQVLLQNPKRVNGKLSDAPQHDHSYCFAMGMPFVPVFFQSAQYLDEAGRKELTPLIALYKKHRKDLFESYSFPIGESPNNESWAGFQFVSEDQKKGHLLLFRELHNQEPVKQLKLKFLQGATLEITNLETGETTQNKVSPDGLAEFELKNPASFAFYSYKVVPPQ